MSHWCHYCSTLECGIASHNCENYQRAHMFPVRNIRTGEYHLLDKNGKYSRETVHIGIDKIVSWEEYNKSLVNDHCSLTGECDCARTEPTIMNGVMSHCEICPKWTIASGQEWSPDSSHKGTNVVQSNTEAPKKGFITMDIYSKPGTKIKYHGNEKCGYEHEAKEAKELFSTEEVYTVKHIIVESWISWVELEEFPGKRFNTVLFENVT